MNYLRYSDNCIGLKNLTKEENNQFKQTIIDFLYRFKDKHPYCKQIKHLIIIITLRVKIVIIANHYNDEMDIFNRVMQFMNEYELIPSKTLEEEYSKSEATKTFTLPDFKTLNDKIGMTQEVYDNLKKRYSSRKDFNFFFNPNIKHKILILNENNIKQLIIGFLNKDVSIFKFNI